MSELPGMWDESDLSGGWADSEVTVPARGRFVVSDGKVFRVQSLWIENRSSELLRLGVVVYRKEGR